VSAQQTWLLSQQRPLGQQTLKQLLRVQAPRYVWFAYFAAGGLAAAAGAVLNTVAPGSNTRYHESALVCYLCVSTKSQQHFGAGVNEQ
jgi:hypothetical protein